MTPEPATGPITALIFTPAPAPGPDTARGAACPPPDPYGPAPADPDPRVPVMAAEILTLTADRFAPTDEALDLIKWNTQRVTAAYGVADEDLLRQVTSSTHAALAFAIVCRYGTAGIEPGDDLDIAATDHLARLTDIPRETHHDLLTTAANLYRPEPHTRPCVACRVQPHPEP